MGWFPSPLLTTSILAIVACAGTAPEPAAGPVEPQAGVPEEPSPHTDPGLAPPPLDPGRSWKRVVVDAGHGGSDLGAQGVSGVLEKDLALAVAKEVARDLRARGLEVVELRPDDRTVELHRRTELANASGAAAFVSLHANSDPSGKAQGVEVYSLDLASDAAAQRVATRENLAGFMAGETGPRAGDLDSVVMDLRLGARVEQSRSLATAVHQDMLSRLTAYYGPGVITDHGRRAAPFWVLADSDMPAILVEVGYLTHPDEERRLRTPGFQRLVGTAVGGAVADFLARAERVDAP